MTRNGKIARLPRAVREQLNCRLADGEQGKHLVVWLNTLPEVKAILTAEFGGRRIRAQNISEWKKGGFREWQLQQDALEQIPLVAAEASELNGKVRGQLSDHMAVWLTAHLMATVRRLAAGNLDDAAKWKLLHEACADFATLRRGDQNVEWMLIEREKLLYQKDDLLLRYKKRILIGVQTMMKAVEKNPKARAAFDAFAAQVREPLDTVEGAP